MDALTPILQSARTKSLRAAMAVAEQGSTAAAARVLHCSQPVVARAVSELEALLGQALFERGSRGMRPTAAGDRVVARARRALQHLARADDGPARPGGRRARISAQASTRQLQVLIALAEHGSERRAAGVLGISQSAVHQALTQLEHLAGEALFDRLASGLRSTAKGAWVIDEVRLAHAELRAGSEELSQLRGQLLGRLAIGTLPFSAGLVVPRALQRVRAMHRGVQVSVVDGTYAALLAQLRQAGIDVLVGALRDHAPEGTVQVPLFDDPLAVVVRAGHPLLARRRLRLADTFGCDWILPMPGAPAHTALAQAFAAEGREAPAGVQINSPTLMQALILGSDHLALMSTRQLSREIEAGLLSVLPVRVTHAPRAIGYTLRDGFAPTPALALFVQALLAATG